MLMMTRHPLPRPLPARSVDHAALRRKALSARARCRRHGVDYAINLLRREMVTAAGYPICFPQFAVSRSA